MRSVLATLCLLAVGVAWACLGAAPLAVEIAVTPRGVEVAAPTSKGGPAGWRMSDRFRGFRFELTLSDGDATAASAATNDVMASTASLARELHCFGWIQAARESVLVGEARCPARAADALETHLRGRAATTVVREYVTTKIRFHFPSFRVLRGPRYAGRTCFATPPHACSSSSSRSPPPAAAAHAPPRAETVVRRPSDEL